LLPQNRDVVGEEDSAEDLGEEGYRSLGKMLQDPARDNFRTRSLADFETPDDILNLVRFG
jgi:hypothetical protein